MLLIFDTPSLFQKGVPLLDPNPLAERHRWNNVKLVAHIVEEGREYLRWGRRFRRRFGLDLLVAELLDDAALELGPQLRPHRFLEAVELSSCLRARKGKDCTLKLLQDLLSNLWILTLLTAAISL